MARTRPGTTPTADAGTTTGSRRAYRPADTSIELRDITIGAALREAAGAHPDRLAVAVGGPGGTEQVTFAELLDLAVRAARGILRYAEPGDRVALWAPNSVSWVVFEYASALAGTVLTPLNPAFRDPEIDHILDLAEPRIVACADDYHGQSLLGRAERLATPRGVHVVRLADWEAQLPDAGVPLPDVAPTAPFILQYTSGTTGKPKGAVLNHRATYNAAFFSSLHLRSPYEGASVALRSATRDVRVIPMPLHHVGGSICGVLTCHSVGATFVTVTAFDAALQLRMIREHRPTLVAGVPTMHLDVLAHPEFDPGDLDEVRVVQIGGSSVAPSLIRRLEEAYGASVVNAYGQSESPMGTQTALDDPPEIKAETIGRPLPHRELKIVRLGTDETADMGEHGEMCFRSPLVMDGYFRMPEQTAAAIDPAGWLHTGDICSLDDTGVVRFHGRAREVIIRGGENIYPPEVEDVFLTHPGVAGVAVVAVPDERWGELPVGVVRRAEGVPPVGADELIAYGLERLAGFKVPRRWCFVDTFPTTASGKIMKFELSRMLSDGALGRDPSAPRV